MVRSPRMPRPSTWVASVVGFGLCLLAVSRAEAVCPVLQAEGQVSRIDDTSFDGAGRLFHPAASAGRVEVGLVVEPLTRGPQLVTWDARLRFEKTDGSFFVGVGILGARPRPHSIFWELFATLEIESGGDGSFALTGSWDRVRREMSFTISGRICHFPYPDRIFTGAILQLRPGAPRAEALAVQGAKIIAVGSTAQILALERPRTEVVALGSRALAPGFVDAHSHLFNGARVHGGAYDELQDLMLSRGVTAIGELFASQLTVNAMDALDAAGGLRVRASLYPVFRNSCEEDLGEWYLAAGARSDPRARLRVPGVKFYLDGPGCEGDLDFAPATTFPQLDWDVDPPYGDLHYDFDELLEIADNARDAGFQVALHAVGDRAQDRALDLLEALQAAGPDPLHHRVEHSTILRPDQFDRIAQVGSVPVVFGRIRTCEELSSGAEPGSWAYSLAPAGVLHYYRPLRDLLEQSPLLVVAWHADASYTDLTKLDPLSDLWQLVTRRALAEDGTVCEPDPHLVSQTVSVEQALRAMTFGGAYALGLDRVTGRLAPGQYADLVLLSSDPLALPVDELRELGVQATFVEGELEYCLPGSNPLCP